jgi:hypothetical protein
MEIIESLLEFDIGSLQSYADGVAEERQGLTKMTERIRDDLAEELVSSVRISPSA